MFWQKQEAVEEEMTDLAQQVAAEAEGLYRSGKMHCAEAVMAAVKNGFAPELPDEVVRMAAGFGGGSASGCICGAVAGGTMALGLVSKGDKKQVTAYTRELHDWFKAKYGVTCCKILTANGKKNCPTFTVAAAGKVAELLMRER